MTPNEIRQRLVAALLDAGEPLTPDELAQCCGVPKARLRRVLGALVGDGAVDECGRAPDGAASHYRWTTRTSALRLAIDSGPVLDFNHYVTHDYTPPAGKRILVVFQCSVRRPFSKSTSHGSMRRAVYAATGYWPRKQFARCPVHVVVLASTVGPVPYELEDVYPATVRRVGVKHFSQDYYEQVLPILAKRMAAYITAHRACYDHITTFTHDRYGDVMRMAGQLADVHFPILPVQGGARVVHMGGSPPRTYWQKHWIQLTLQLIEWLEPEQQKQAAARLKKLKVEYR